MTSLPRSWSATTDSSSSPRTSAGDGELRDLAWTVYAAGVSRGNPGPAAIGAVILNPSGRQVHTISFRIGRASTNEAAYRAAVAALEAALALGVRSGDLRLGSTLMVSQLRHRVRVRDPRLRPLFARLVDLRRRFDSLTTTAIAIAQNARVAALASQALDRLED